MVVVDDLFLVNYIIVDLNDVIVTENVMDSTRGGMCILSKGIPILIGRAAVRRAFSMRTGDSVRVFRRFFFALTPSSGCVHCAVRGTVCLVSRAKLTRCGTLGRGKFCGGLVKASAVYDVFYSDVQLGGSSLAFACCNERQVRHEAGVLVHRVIATNGLGGMPEARGGPRNVLVAG